MELLNHVNWKSGVHLVGISMGGMISQELALLEPRRFDTLTLIATHAGRTIPPWTVLYKFPQMFVMSDEVKRLRHLLTILFPPEKRAMPAPVDFVPAHLPPNLLKSSSGEGGYLMEDKYLDTMLARAKRTKSQTLRGAIGQLCAANTHCVVPDRLRILKKQEHVDILVIVGTWDNVSIYEVCVVG